METNVVKLQEKIEGAVKSVAVFFINSTSVPETADRFMCIFLNSPVKEKKI